MDCEFFWSAVFAVILVFEVVAVAFFVDAGFEDGDELFEGARGVHFFDVFVWVCGGVSEFVRVEVFVLSEAVRVTTQVVLLPLVIPHKLLLVHKIKVPVP